MPAPGAAGWQVVPGSREAAQAEHHPVGVMRLPLKGWVHPVLPQEYQ